MSSRSLRAKRKDVVQAKRGAFEPFFRPDGASFIDDLLAGEQEDAPLTLSTGERLDLREPWAVPKQE